MRRLLAIFKADQRGALLAETLIAVSVFTLIGSAVMTGVSATSSASQRMRAIAVADTIASNQLTEILSDPYVDPPYTFTPITPPTGYTVTATASQFIPGDTYIAKIVVSVYEDGQLMTSLESLRFKDQ